MKRKTKFFKLIRRWPTIVALVLSFCLLLCQTFYITAVYRQNREQNLACAQLIAQQASEQFEQLFDSIFDCMRVTASQLGKSDEGDAVLLTALGKATGVSKAVLVKDSEQDTAIAMRYTINGSSSIALLEDGNIRLCRRYPQGEIRVTPNLNLLDAQLRELLCGSFEYMVFNADTGDYLINRSDISETYYEFLMAIVDEPTSVDELLREKNATTTLKLNGDKHRSYIAQCSTGLSQWNIAFIIPETSLPSAAGHSTTVQIAVFMFVSLLLFVITFGALAELLRLRKNQLATKKLLGALSGMADKAVKQSGQALFVYQRDNEDVPLIKDGMGIMEPKLESGSIDEVISAFGLSREEGERLTDAIHALQPNETNAVTVNSADSGTEEHTLQFTLSRLQDNDKLVCVIVRDCTQDRFNREREIEELHFSRNMYRKANLIWQYNVSRGSWRLAFARGLDPARMGVTPNHWRNSDADLANLLRTLLHSADYDSFCARMSAQAVAEMYHCGRDEAEIEYRMKMPDEDEYTWYKQSVRVFRDAKTNDIMADIYVVNIDAEKRAEMERSERKQILQQTLTALGSVYYGLYYIDLDTNTSYTVKSLGGDMVTQLADSFEKQFADHIDTRVHPDEQQQLHDLLNCYHLKRVLSPEKPSIHLTFRRRAGVTYRTSTLILQSARFENGVVRDIVLALRKEEE